MKNVLFILAILSISLFSVNHISAQNLTIPKIKENNFKGVYPIDGLGFLVCHIQKSKIITTVYDYDFKEKWTTNIDEKFNLAGIRAYSNKESYLFLMHEERSTKKKVHYITYDKQGKEIGRLDANAKGLGVLTDDNHYYIYDYSNKEKSLILKKLTNDLKEVWSYSFDKKEMLAANFTQMYGEGFNTRITDEAIYLQTYRMEKLRLKDTKISAIDLKTGEKLYEYKFKEKKELPFMFDAQGKRLKLLVHRGDFSNLFKISTGTLHYIEMTETGEKKTDTKIEARGKFTGLNKLGMRSRSQFPKRLDIKDGKPRLITETVSGTAFIVYHFDADFQPDESIKVGKKKSVKSRNPRSIEDMIPSDYKGLVPSKSGDFDWILYINKQKKSISVEAAASNGENKRTALDKVDFIGQEKDNNPEKIKINWYKLMPSTAGKAIFAVYNKKKKKVDIYEVVLE